MQQGRVGRWGYGGWEAGVRVGVEGRGRVGGEEPGRVVWEGLVRGAAVGAARGAVEGVEMVGGEGWAREVARGEGAGEGWLVEGWAG